MCNALTINLLFPSNSLLPNTETVQIDLLSKKKPFNFLH
uniref:Uncharacterized protein n=1 Tax=Arundo donax TaxID=35708 RepID=A0A0A9B7H6_ARUDO